MTMPKEKKAKTSTRTLFGRFVPYEKWMWAFSIISLIITWILMYEISHINFTGNSILTTTETPADASKLETPINDVSKTSVSSLQDQAIKDIVMGKEIELLWKEIRLQQRRAPDHVYKLNVSFSDSITLNRVHKDQRPHQCENSFSSKLPSTTIIIPFYNEALSMLLRTVHSILITSPAHLIDEIVLVDDGSDYENLKDPLTLYADKLPKVTVIRNEKRIGLIKSRMVGAHKAQSEVLIFMDAHMEATMGWIQPLLQYLKDNPTAIIQPEVDEIDPNSLEYQARSKFLNFPEDKVLRGGFNWDLRYAWIPLPREQNLQRTSAADAFPSATLVGCAIAVNKDEFFELGAFDDEMQIWGGENIELGFRAWQCNRTVMTIPCSRVGHVFRTFPYSFGKKTKENIVGSNLMRIAEIWMDDYKRLFYATWRAFPFKRTRLTREERKSIKLRYESTRERMQCQSFQWYLDNVAQNLNIPTSDAVYFGEVYNEKSKGCLMLADDQYVVMHFECYPTRIMPENEFYIDLEGRFKLHSHPEHCLKVDDKTGFLKQSNCSGRHEQWRLYGETTYGHLIVTIVNEHDTRDLCLVQITNVLEQHQGEQMPQVVDCDEHDEWQRWVFNYKLDYVS